jgi:hypothetical protein
MSEGTHALLRTPEWRNGTAIGSLALLASSGACILASRYATRVAGPPVGDLLLDHLPLLDVTFLHVYAATLFWLGILVFILRHPAYLPFTLKTTAVFLGARAFFVVLTHLGPPPNLLKIPADVTALYVYRGDLFFSGHAGGPFLFALILERYRLAHGICLAATGLFSIIVLVGHVHYSIDVFASFFIAHSIHALMASICMDHQFIESEPEA